MSHSSAPLHPTSPPKCNACAERFAWLNLGLNSGLLVLKVVVGLLAGSRALLAASMYSVNDVLSAVAVIVSLKVAGKPPTKEHPFGHGKVEFIAIGVVSLMLAASLAFFVYSIFEIVHGSKAPPAAVAIGVAVLSVGTCELLARRGFCVAERLNSPSLETSAEHNRADAIASLAVVGGLVAAEFGLHVVDQLVAIYEAADVAHLSGVLLGRSLKGLMDSALPPLQLDLLRAACLKIPGVKGVQSIRSRRVGSGMWLDIVLGVDEDQSVEAAHEITRRAHGVVRGTLGHKVQAQIGFRAHAAPPTTMKEASAHA